MISKQMNTREQEGFAHETNDCAVLALANVTGMTYAEAHKRFKEQGRRDRKGTPTMCICRTLNRLTDDGKLVHKPVVGIASRTVAQAARMLPKGRYYVYSRRHAFCIVDGIVIDSNRRALTRARIADIREICLTEPKVEAKPVSDLTQSEPMVVTFLSLRSVSSALSETCRLLTRRCSACVPTLKTLSNRSRLHAHSMHTRLISQSKGGSNGQDIH